jgi:hypothetical protein
VPRLLDEEPRLPDNVPRFLDEEPRLPDNVPRLLDEEPRLPDNVPRFLDGEPRFLEQEPKLPLPYAVSRGKKETPPCASSRAAPCSRALSQRSSPALAQDSTFVEKKSADGQDVRFKDDPVSALAGNPVGAQLTGFHPPRRFDLLRPRWTFVPEMLKSVEHL